jgi:hypothetical protein
MSHKAQFEALLRGSQPILALAPMQDVTDLPFWRLMSQYGGPDVYYTEYFRVHPTSNLQKSILESITKNPGNRPVIAQMIGNDIPSLVRTAKEFQQYPVAAVDLNLGRPAPCLPEVRRRRPAARTGEGRCDFGRLAEAIEIKFTVKTRLDLTRWTDRSVVDDLCQTFAGLADRARTHRQRDAEAKCITIYRAFGQGDALPDSGQWKYLLCRESGWSCAAPGLRVDDGGAIRNPGYSSKSVNGSEARFFCATRPTCCIISVLYEAVRRRMRRKPPTSKR